MWKLRCLNTLWASTACYRDTFAFFFKEDFTVSPIYATCPDSDLHFDMIILVMLSAVMWNRGKKVWHFHSHWMPLTKALSSISNSALQAKYTAWRHGVYICIGAPIILGRCPSLSAHESESMLRTYLVYREKRERERERARERNGTWENHTVY
jgi:hypothetical protein